MSQSPHTKNDMANVSFSHPLLFCKFLPFLASDTEEFHQTEEYHQDGAQPEEHADDHQDQQPDLQHNEQSADHVECPTSDSPDELATGDVSNLTAEDHDYLQIHGDQTEALDDENEYSHSGNESGADLNEENTDTGAAHSNGDSVAAAVSIGDAEPTEYEEYAEVEEYNERYGEVLPEQEDCDAEADSKQTSGHQGTDDDEKPTEADNAHVALPDTVILRAASTVDLAEPADEQSAVEDRFTDGDPEGAQTLQALVILLLRIFPAETFGEIKKTDAEATSRDDLGRLCLFAIFKYADGFKNHDSVGTVTKNSVPGVNESDSNFVAMLRHETVLPG